MSSSISITSRDRAAGRERGRRHHPIKYNGGVNGSLQFPGRSRGLRAAGQIRTRNATLRIRNSGLGGVFPPGLSIGEVPSSESSPERLVSRRAEVKLDERLGSLTEVTVLVPLNPEEN